MTNKSTNPKAVIRRINRALAHRDGNWAARVIKLRPGQHAVSAHDFDQPIFQYVQGNALEDEGHSVRWVLDFEAELTMRRG